LDRILVSKNWEDIFPNSLVRKLPREVSDHNPPYSLFWAMSKLKTFAIQV
jgi:hypothetical protein